VTSFHPIYRGHRLTFLPEFHADLSRYKEKRVHCSLPATKHPPFGRHFALMRPRAPTLEIWVHPIHTPVKCYPDPLRFAGVIREKPILSKYVLQRKINFPPRSLMWLLNIWPEWRYLYCESEKQSTIILSITLPNVDRFSKFVHWQIPWWICNKTVINYPSTP